MTGAADPPQPERFSMRAEASESAQIYQAGRDQHFYYGEGAHGTRRTVPGAIAEDCPYPGLQAFTVGQERWFFGRDGATADLIIRLDARLRTGGPQLVIAPSGAGKTSLLNAGLLPRLASGALPGSARWPKVVGRPTADPVRAFATAVAPIVECPPDEIDRLVAAVRETLGDNRLVVVVDQFEELFTVCVDEDRREAYIDLLTDLAAPGPSGQPAALVVIGLRADFFALCANNSRLRTALQDKPLVVGPMSETELRQAIRNPALDVGVDLEPGLVELLLRDLRSTDAEYEAGRLPLLAHALRTTWLQHAGATLTVADYQRTGGIERAIATSAEQVLANLDSAAAAVAPGVLLRLVKVGEDTTAVRQRLPRAALLDGAADPAAAVLDAFTNARLLTQYQDTVEITHEALIRAWPRLRAWIDDNRAGLLAHQRLAEAAATWVSKSRDQSALYRGTLLADADALSHNPSRRLAPLEHEFIAASRAAQRRSTRRLRRTVAVLAALLVLTLVAAGIAVAQWQEARHQARVATAKGLVSQADALHDTDPRTALRLALAAYRIDQTPQTREALLTTVVQTKFVGTLTDFPDAVETTAYGPDGTLITSSGTTLSWWDPSNRRRLASQTLGTDDQIEGTAQSPDGRLFAAITHNGMAGLWDVSDRTAPRQLSAWKAYTDDIGSLLFRSSIAFAANGTLVTNGVLNSSIGFTVWNIADPQRPSRLSATEETVAKSLAVSAGGTLLVSAEGNGSEASLWRVGGRTPPSMITKFEVTGVGSDGPEVAFHPREPRLAVASGRLVSIWDVSKPEQPEELTVVSEHGDQVFGLAFHPSMDMLATASFDGTTIMWNIEEPRDPTLWQRFRGHTAGVFSVAFSPDGYHLATGSVDRTAIIWRLGSETELGGNRIHSNLDIAPTAVAFSPDRRTMAVGHEDRTVALWDMSDVDKPRKGAPFTVPLVHYKSRTARFDTHGVYHLAFAGSGTLVTVDYGIDVPATGSVTVWRVEEGRRATVVATLNDSTILHNYVSVDREGRVLLADRELWDLGDVRRLASFPAKDNKQIDDPYFDGDPVAVNAGGTLAVTDGGQILWDISDPAHPTELARLDVPDEDNRYETAFSPDGRLLAATGVNGSTLVWDITDPRNPRPLPPLRGHRGYITAIAWSPDSRIIATAGFDQQVALWDMTDPANPVRLHTVSGHFDWLHDIAISPDGSTLVTAGRDGRLITRPLRPLITTMDNFVAEACKIADGDLSTSDWERYTTGVPYEASCPAG